MFLGKESEPDFDTYSYVNNAGSSKGLTPYPIIDVAYRYQKTDGTIFRVKIGTQGIGGSLGISF